MEVKETLEKYKEWVAIRESITAKAVTRLQRDGRDQGNFCDFCIQLKIDEKLKEKGKYYNNLSVYA
jgi:hypothetical protein